MPENKDKPAYKEAYLSRPAAKTGGSDDLSKPWYVDYRVWSEQREQLVRKRIAITGKTARERVAESTQLIEQINKMLKKGVVIEKLPKITRPAPSIVGGITANSSVDDAAQFFQTFKESSLSKQSIKTYKSSLNNFRVFLMEKKIRKMKLSLFSREFAIAYLDYVKFEQKATNRTYNKHKGYCCTMFNFYVDERKILGENPFADISKLPVTASRHVPFLPEQIAEVKKYYKSNPDPQMWLFINFIYYTFSRPHEEVRRLLVRDISKRVIIIKATDAKDNETNPKLISPGLERLLIEQQIRSYPPHFYVFGKNGKPGPEPMGETYFYSKHRKMLDAIGLPSGQYDLYGWKHTGVIALYLVTKDMKLIQRMCGHSDIQTTDQYLRDLGLFLDEDQVKDFPEL